MSSESDRDSLAQAPSVTYCPKVLVFHKLTSKYTFGSTNYSPQRFSHLLSFLKRKGYVYKSLEAVLMGDDPRAVAITFDDGYYHLADILPPLMDRYKFQPIVFLPTRFLGKANTWDYSHLFRATPHLDDKRIRELSEFGVDFGSHGHSHSDLTRCNTPMLHQELWQSKEMLEDVLGRQIESISYPFGRINQRVLDAAREAGYRRGFSMTFPDVGDSELTTGRYAVYGFDTCGSVVRKLIGGRGYRWERWKAQMTNRLSGGTMVYRRLWGRKE